jgi:hypothetical protein
LRNAAKTTPNDWRRDQDPESGKICIGKIALIVNAATMTAACRVPLPSET